MSALRFYSTGASFTGEAQRDADASTGLYRSSTETGSLGILRRGTPITNITVDYACGTIGHHSLRVTGDNLIFDGGTAVTILNGETKTLLGGVTSNWIRVTRTSADTMTGTETLYFATPYNNVVGGRDVVTAEQAAGLTLLRAVMIKPDAAITDLAVWLGACDDTVRISWETPTAGALSNGTPATPTWNTGATAALGLTDAAVAAGEEVGLWIERTTAAAVAASPKRELNLNYSYKIGTATYTGRLAGLYRIENTALNGYLVWIAAEPDPSTAADVTSATLPIDITPTGSQKVLVRARNKYGLVSQNIETLRVSVDGNGVQVSPAPTAPEGLAVVGNAAGKAVVTALYNAYRDGNYPATTWNVYLWTDNETEPVTPTDTVTMFGGNLAYLSWTSTAAYSDGTPVNVKVTVSNTGATSAAATATGTIGLIGPTRPTGTAFYSRSLAQHPGAVTPPGAADEYVVDVTDDVRIEVYPDSSTLYAGLQLIWRILRDVETVYVPTDFDIDLGTAVTGTGGEDPLEWNTGVLYVVVNGTRRLSINPTTKAITHLGRDYVTAPTTVSPPYPVWGRFMETAFGVWNGADERWETVFDVTSTSLLRSRYGWNTALTQAQIEAL